MKKALFLSLLLTVGISSFVFAQLAPHDPIDPRDPADSSNSPFHDGGNGNNGGNNGGTAPCGVSSRGGIFNFFTNRGRRISPRQDCERRGGTWIVDIQGSYCKEAIVCQRPKFSCPNDPTKCVSGLGECFGPRIPKFPPRPPVF